MAGLADGGPLCYWACETGVGVWMRRRVNERLMRACNATCASCGSGCAQDKSGRLLRNSGAGEGLHMGDGG